MTLRDQDHDRGRVHGRGRGRGRDAEGSTTSGWRRLALRGSLVAGVVVAAGVLWDGDAIRQLSGSLRAGGASMALAFIAAGSLGIMLGAPRLAVAALAGAAYGWTLGFALAFAATLLGSLMAFGLGRWIGRDWIHRHGGPRLMRIDRACREQGLLVCIVMRTIPVGFALLTNLVLSATSMRAREFVLGTALGVVPSTLIVARAGDELVQGTVWMGAGLVVGALALGLLAARLAGRTDLGRRVKPETHADTAWVVVPDGGSGP